MRKIFISVNIVVEDPILRGYHNTTNNLTFVLDVVEGPILRGYHNLIALAAFPIAVVEDPILRGYHNTKEIKSTITGVRKWFLDKGTIKNKKSIVSIKKSI